MNAITTGTEIVFTKGCPYLGIRKGQLGVVTVVDQMGTDYGHSCRVVFTTAGRTATLWVRHRNRLGDVEVRAHRGDPTRYVVFGRNPTHDLNCNWSRS